MVIEIRPSTPSSQVVIADLGMSDGTWSAAHVEDVALEEQARSGRLFLMGTDDPVYYRVDLYVDEPIPDHLERLFTGNSGAFLLRLPTGRAVFAAGVGEQGGGAIPEGNQQVFEVPPGDYAVCVRDRAVADVQAHQGQRPPRPDEAAAGRPHRPRPPRCRPRTLVLAPAS